MFTKGPIGPWKSGSKIKELGYRRKERPLETYGPPRVSPLLVRSVESSQPRGYTRRSSLQSTTSDCLSKQTAYNVRPMIHPRFDVMSLCSWSCRQLLDYNAGIFPNKQLHVLVPTTQLKLCCTWDAGSPKHGVPYCSRSGCLCKPSIPWRQQSEQRRETNS